MADPVDVQIFDESDNLFVFFGGIASGISIPPFEFYNSAKILAASKIFIRDFDQCWYQTGLRNISDDYIGTAEYLQNQIAKLNPNRLVFAGNSMGGFAAILFGSFFDGAEIIAFAPQSFISPFRKVQYKDFRWPRQTINTYVRSLMKRRVLDLRPYLLGSNGDQKVSIYVSADDHRDKLHAFRLADIPGINVTEVPGKEHNVVRYLRDRDLLAKIMSGS